MRSVYYSFLNVLAFAFANGLLLAPASFALSSEPQKVDFVEEFKKISAMNLYDLDPKLKEKKLMSLSR
ncbi:MAG: hypothetical protein ACXWRE_03615, partial [Pseudobdellovibrionaceae bacterium]